MHITLTGQCISQKNDKRMAFNKRTGKPFPVSSAAVKQWQSDVAKQLMAYRGQADGRVMLTCEFYHKDKRKRDLDNELSSVQDALVKAGLLPGDDCFVIIEAHAIFGGIDVANPRVEITLEEVDS